MPALEAHPSDRARQGMTSQARRHCFSVVAEIVASRGGPRFIARRELTQRRDTSREKS